MLHTSVWFAASAQVAVTKVSPATGEGFKNITAGVGSIVTALALLVGGAWAYLKFVRGRTYKPRLSVDLAGQWRALEGVGSVLHLGVHVTNIGASKASLKQYGTGLTLSFPGEQQTAPDDVTWVKVPLRVGSPQDRQFEIFKEHEWIEPNETVSDDVLVNPGRDPTITMVEAVLMWGKSPHKRLARALWGEGADDSEFHRNDIEVFARRIIPVESTMIDNHSPQSTNDGSTK
jgi:hypothetical protein